MKLFPKPNMIFIIQSRGFNLSTTNNCTPADAPYNPQHTHSQYFFSNGLSAILLQRKFENAQMLIMFHLLVMVSEPALKIVPFEVLPPSNSIPTLVPYIALFMLNGCPSMKISSDLVDRTGL